MRLRIAILPLLLTLALAACGGDGEEPPGGNQPAANPTTPPAAATSQPTAAAPTAAPTARPVVLNQTQQSQLILTQAELSSLFGTTPFQQIRSNIADVRQAYASSAELGDFLASQNATGLYNAWSATSQCVVCAVQISVPVFPNEAAATMAYQRVQQVNQAIFQNVAQAQPLGASWDSSLCQTGTFTSSGQTLNWLFCAARKGNAVVTVAVGGFNFDASNVANQIRTAANRMDAYIKAQFP
jgi:hypothetical protein